MNREERAKLARLVAVLKNCIILDQTKLVNAILEKTLDDNVTYLPFKRAEMEHVQEMATKYQFKDKFYSAAALSELSENARADWMEALEKCKPDEECQALEFLYKDSELALNDPVIRPVTGWFVVNDFLADQLRMRGEVILENEYGRWWGRLSPLEPFWNDEALISIAKFVEKNIPRDDRLRGRVCG